ncbi:hypothetical protein G8A07_23750 [Roseateles sp. DAIF2]|uniref:hypothetical protein n=1 Tax=Roseateles sp. DAIF2 TaxID=2714952 RepID=UPI0018A3261B|nr:hypothetical protein [Roseateles sp. DAIF2]QPF75632.1 hypothetical protein G8A07_23750 [Roseateles sp. DAIF2]
MSARLRTVLGSIEDVWSLKGQAVRVSSLGTMSKAEALAVTLSSQGTTNPGTKELPKVYFQSATTPPDWKRALAAYRGNWYLLVTKASPNHGRISWFQGDYVLIGDLHPDSKDFIVSEEVLREAMLGEKNGAKNGGNDPRE